MLARARRFRYSPRQLMKLCRFKRNGVVSIGIMEGETIRDLSAAGERSLSALLDDPARLQSLSADSLPVLDVSRVELLAPIEQQEVWAAGVTYLRSKKARMEESDFSASAYDRVYEAARPELFFKSLAHKVSGPGGPIGIRQDAKWNVPEPELALVINSRKELAGFTIGNDMSSRDIEGENLLYLPQAKVYKHSCALGPAIVVGASEQEARGWTISIAIERGGNPVFSGETSVNQIKRTFAELIDYACRSQDFPHGLILLTGTGIVPGDEFTLHSGDVVTITICGIGTLKNTVVEV